MSPGATAQAVRDAIARDAARAGRPLTLMEVCGTHTMAIYRHGLPSLLPEAVRLISGPGCPVCVTSQGQIDQIIALARQPGVTIGTFGDMIRVPGSESSLEHERARGADVRVLYAPTDALSLAAEQPSREVILIGIGFETTAPTVAATVAEARRHNVRNLSLVSACKRIPPALDALLASGDLTIDGLICPGHVSVIIGSDAYKPLVERYRLACVVAGFEPDEVLDAIAALVRQAAEGRIEVENRYATWVRPDGNRRALEMLDEVFAPATARWRGLGVIGQSGLALRESWRDFDAAERFNIEEREVAEPPGCRCGDVLRGQLTPLACPLFAGACTPEHPVGPCMVSTEGSCSAAFRYNHTR
jgi:hydrogenase expression/formation protein HypD